MTWTWTTSLGPTTTPWPEPPIGWPVAALRTVKPHDGSEAALIVACVGLLLRTAKITCSPPDPSGWVADEIGGVTVTPASAYVITTVATTSPQPTMRRIIPSSYVIEGRRRRRRASAAHIIPVTRALPPASPL